jgi:hypothetical protein
MRERRRQVARARARRRRTALLVALGAAAGIAVLWWLLTGPVTAVQGVRVAGYDRDDRDDLAAALGAAASGGSMISPPVDDLRAAAARFPWVESISVRRDLPRMLAVVVEQAEPAAVAVPAAGAPVLVTASGRVLGPAAERNPGLGWLRLDAEPPAPGGTLPGESRAAAAFLAAAPPAAASRVRALRREEGGVLVAELRGGPELRLGRPERLEAKAVALGIVLDHLSEEEERAAAYLDLSAPERPALGSS